MSTDIQTHTIHSKGFGEAIGAGCLVKGRLEGDYMLNDSDF